MADWASWPVSRFHLYLPYVTGRAGLEIGGPSPSFDAGGAVPIYPKAASVDNCDFVRHTVWSENAQKYLEDAGRMPGREFFCEGSQLSPIASDSYDFLLSSHNLEHFANPVKALYEWKRVLRPGGALILILPDYRNTFDHQRSVTPVSHMLEDFERGVGEDDLAHLPEILEKHDLSMDPLAGDYENFRERSLHNPENRCLHHHVFDEENSQELLKATGFDVLSAEVVRPNHICLLARA